MRDKNLYYEIDSWNQACDCMSNASDKLHITYDIVLDRGINGGIIRIEHDDYGCLFSYLVNGSGNLLIPDCNDVVFELTNDEILMELHKYGFNIKFSKRIDINDSQYQLLSSAQLFGMDKIRLMYVDSSWVKQDNHFERKARLVIFNPSHLLNWLDNQKVCTRDEFANAIDNGYAINVTHAVGGLTPGNDWSFLYEHIFNVSDLLKHCR